MESPAKDVGPTENLKTGKKLSDNNKESSSMSKSCQKPRGACLSKMLKNISLELDTRTCVSMAPPLWNMIGHRLLLPPPHWSDSCRSTNLTRETSLQLYARAAAGGVLRERRTQHHLSPSQQKQLRVSSSPSPPLVPPHLAVDVQPVDGVLMAKRLSNVRLTWLWLLLRPPRDRYGF